MNRKCNKGIKCKGTCIERSDTCVNSTSIAIAKRLSELRAKVGYIRSEKTNSIGVRSINLSFEQEQNASIKISNSIFKGYTQIDFMMNGSADANKASVPNSLKLKMAKAVKNEINKVLSEYPEGSKFAAIPNYSDGKRESRIKAYMKAGFGPMSTSTEHMSAVLINGKLQPGEMIEFNE